MCSRWIQLSGDNDATHSAGTSSPLFTQNEPASKYSPEQDSSSYSSDQVCWPTTAPENIFSGSPTLDGVGFWQQEQCNTSIYEPKRIPINPQLDPFDLDSMKSLILVQYTRLAHRIAFRPFPYPVELGLTNYLVRGSHLICKTLYLGARISQALLDDTNWQGYIGWIDTFHNRILGTQSALVESNVSHLADRLAANCNVSRRLSFIYTGTTDIPKARSICLHDSEQLNWIYDLPKRHTDVSSAGRKIS
ncbi:hypothetical protein AG1IA_09947 [Rhizoctonia solani AG-1 IA]|uniref:Uncharacterized protein n=1 Tax=Thanatephorus cucumeris (strain AG1-IA) TaxID=983506 RepID=L8WGW3_THACA|nr:hypothetical protein AG1IA_09947 [Rhizoctonia solani AG-1 IA]